MVLVLTTQIDASPDRRFGKPCIIGTRMAVHDIVLMHVRQHRPLAEIASAYDLSMAAIHAAMAYYYEHREQVDAEIDAENAAIDSAAASTPSRLREKLAAVRNE